MMPKGRNRSPSPGAEISSRRWASKAKIVAGPLLFILCLSCVAVADDVIIRRYEEFFVITDKYSPWESTCWGKIQNISGWHRSNVTLIVEPYDEASQRMAVQVIEIGLMGINSDENFWWHPPLGMKSYRYLVRGN